VCVCVCARAYMLVVVPIGDTIPTLLDVAAFPLLAGFIAPIPSASWAR
jgi:hypothetical protein